MLTRVDDVPRAFSDAVHEAYAARPGPRFALVLSGGPTAGECYEVLAATEGIDWSLVDIYVGDERVVPPDDDDANQRLIKEALLDRVGPVGSFSPMPTVGPVDECVAAYQRTMSDLVTGPGIDLVHLGMGPDGHTASLFAGAPTLDAEPGVLVLATEDPNGVNPHPRLTLTLPAINFVAHCRLHGGRRLQGGGSGRAGAGRRPAGRPRPRRTDPVAGRRRRPRRRPLD